MHGCTHAAQTTTIPGAPGSREAGEPWKALRVHISEPALAKQQDDAISEFQKPQIHSN